MRVPFSRELNDLFRKDGLAWLKILGGGVVGAVVAVWTISKTAGAKGPKLGPTGRFWFVLATTIIGIVVALALTLKDVVRSRIDAGRPVNPLLRAFLGSGVLSLVLWVIVAFVAAIGLIFLPL